MASNYTFSEAVELIAKGDMKAIQDIGRRFPILATKIATVSALAGESFIDLASYMPDYLTANKVNKGMRDALEETDETENDENDEVDNDEVDNDEEEIEETDETEIEETDETEIEETDETEIEETDETENDENEEVDNDEEETDMVDYSKMTAQELWDILGKAGKRNTAKSKKKADLVTACEALANEVEEEAEEDEAEETDNPYEGKTAMELFKECKKRGIKAASKKPAKFYADLLLKADAEGEEEDDEDEDDDWDI